MNYNLRIISLYYSMATQAIMKKSGKQQSVGIYSRILITKKISLHITHIGENIKQTLEKVVSSQIEGKCIVEGYIKPASIKILTYSTGEINGVNIMFEVVFECFVCSPVEGMHIKCIARNITKAGIRAETDEEPSPVVIFIARDHHTTKPYFSNVNQNDIINVRVIGQRFELNDKYISIIAELIEPKETKIKTFKKPRLVIKP